MNKLKHTVVTWALSISAGIAVLFLNAYLEHQHSETDALQRSADIDNERAAEWVAMGK
ncbi:hypothetical protein [Variovorax paradoxus]|jgi:hypothetical protein|uniref:hypothetical protein n=1 Tax=Variovorax paradoxus TaxID=34073 RepID=UPI000B23CF75